MNKEQFTEKVLAMEQSLYCVARTILQNDEDCADAMQDAILSAYRKLDTLKEERYFKTWLTRILINECYTQLRSRKNQISYEEYMETGERESTVSDTSGQETYSELFCELESMEEQYRLPLILHYVVGYSTREIAKMLETTEGSIRTRLYRGWNILKKRLEDGI